MSNAKQATLCLRKIYLITIKLDFYSFLSAHGGGGGGGAGYQSMDLVRWCVCIPAWAGGVYLSVWTGEEVWTGVGMWCTICGCSSPQKNGQKAKSNQ